MSRLWPVVKREFSEMVRTKAFVIGTVLGPVLIIGLFALQIAMAGAGNRERAIAIVGEADEALIEQVAAALQADRITVGGESRSRFIVETHTTDAGNADALRGELIERIEADELDGYLWLPATVIDGAAALYEGKNATNLGDMERIRAAVQVTVQGVRLRTAGIDQTRVAQALQPVAFEARKTGEKAATGTPAALMVLTYILGFAVYMIVIFYGNAVLRGVLEEKRDRVVEVIVSSIRADQLLTGKVIGIGAAGILQIAIWIAFSTLALTRGDEIAAHLGGSLPELPAVPISVAGIFLLYFLVGFILYAGIYAAMGAIATTDQEAQQLQLPVIMLLVVALSAMAPVLNDPAGPVAVAASLVPFTAPIVMPMRAAISEIPLPQLIGSVVILILTAIAVLWLAARIYRIGIFATGKRATPREVWRWLREA